MNRTMLKSKIHRALVTQADVNYEGSITIDEELMDLTDIKEYELVRVWDVTNGNRLETYAIKGPRGSRVIGMNGAAAHLIRKSDIVIIASFVDMQELEIPPDYAPRIVYMEGKNSIKGLKNIPQQAVV